MKELTERLKLKPDQVGPVRAILEQDQKKREAIQPDEDLSDPRLAMAKLFKAFQKLDQETKEALSKVLTPDQLAEYEKFKEKQRKRLVRDQYGPPKKGPGGKRPPDDARGPSRR
jgi:hypothetical protein